MTGNAATQEVALSLDMGEDMTGVGDNQVNGESEKKLLDNSNYREEQREGILWFICNVCNWEANEAKRVKMHISAKHKKGEKTSVSVGPKQTVSGEATRRKRSDDSEDEDEDAKKVKIDPLDESLLKWDKSQLVASTQMGSMEHMLNMFDEDGKPHLSDVTQEQLEIENTVIDATDDISDSNGNSEELVNELNEKNMEIAQLKEEIEKKENFNMVAQGKINGLEQENARNIAMAEKFHRIARNLQEENKNLKENGSAELKNKLNKAREDIRKKDKEIKDDKSNLTEVHKKLADEMNIRAKAEAEVVKLSKVIDSLNELLDKKKKATVPDKEQQAVQSNKGKTKCRDQNKPGGCKFGTTCMFEHDDALETVEIIKTVDCKHWMGGHCKFSDKNCRDRHDERKRGIKPFRSEKVSELDPRECGSIKSCSLDLSPYNLDNRLVSMGARSSSRVECKVAQSSCRVECKQWVHRWGIIRLDFRLACPMLVCRVVNTSASSLAHNPANQ